MISLNSISTAFSRRVTGIDVHIFISQMSVFDASEKYRSEGRSLIILAGKDYGSGSSRDWAAKGPWMLVRFLFHIMILRLLHGRRVVSDFHY